MKKSAVLVIILILILSSGCNKEIVKNKEDYLDLKLPELSKYIEQNIEKVEMDDADKLLIHFEKLQKKELPVIDYTFYEKYLEYISKDLKEYFIIMSMESEQASAKDEIFKRALRQEEFLIKYPESEKSEDIRLLFNKYVYLIYNGLNNNPLFEERSGRMKEEAVIKYNEIIKEEFDSSLINDLSIFMYLLEKNDYVLNSTSKEYRETISLGFDEDTKK